MHSDNELEQLLRKAPSPAAPFGLERRLIQQASKPKQTSRAGWFSVFQRHSWAPALALFAVLTGLITALGFQQSTLTALKREQEKLTAHTLPGDDSSRAQSYQPAEQELDRLQKQSVELQGLREEMAEIERLLAQQPAIAQENAKLRAELAALAPNRPELSPEYQAAMDKARQKAERIRCVNNLKNLGLAARVWASDNADKSQLPKDFLTIKNELGTPKILICPSDTARTQPIDRWEQFSGAGSSYELLAPGISEQTPNAIYARCPFHNNVLKADGAVFQLRTDQKLVQRDGHWEIGE